MPPLFPCIKEPGSPGELRWLRAKIARTYVAQTALRELHLATRSDRIHDELRAGVTAVRCEWAANWRAASATAICTLSVLRLARELIVNLSKNSHHAVEIHVSACRGIISIHNSQ